jgi:predicted AAA+ superfamily ATPase
MEQSTLEEFNHWWIEGKVDTDLALPFKRNDYIDIEKSINKRFIVALIGLRRVGKTTTLYQLIQWLIAEKVHKTNILFFSFDEISIKLGEVIEKYKELQKKDLREEKVYIFLDEIQKCNNWQNELKKYYDLYPKIKFIISGSESLFIKKKTGETLAGRITEFMLTPFTFREYLRFKGLTEEDLKYETKVKPLFHTFIEKGGFPETFTFESEREHKEYLRTLVVDKIVYKDIPLMFKLEDPEFLRVLLELIATNPGMYIDYQSLSKQFEKDRRVVKDYISYLKESFLIKLLGNYRKGSITTLRKKKRAYPADNGIISLYKSKIEQDFFGRMVESSAVNKINAQSFWKNGNEIDIVHNTIPIEIKYQEKINAEDFKPVRHFMRKFSINKGIVVTKKEEKDIHCEEGIIKLIPAWKWFLE